eukprot:10661558-Karenia_brevis.AAC.1
MKAKIGCLRMHNNLLSTKEVEFQEKLKKRKNLKNNLNQFLIRICYDSRDQASKQRRKAAKMKNK